MPTQPPQSPAWKWPAVGALALALVGGTAWWALKPGAPAASSAPQEAAADADSSVDKDKALAEVLVGPQTAGTPPPAAAEAVADTPVLTPVVPAPVAPVVARDESPAATSKPAATPKPTAATTPAKPAPRPAPKNGPSLNDLLD